MPGKIDHRRMIDHLLAPWRVFARFIRLYRELFFRHETTMPPVLTYFEVYLRNLMKTIKWNDIAIVYVLIIVQLQIIM